MSGIIGRVSGGITQAVDQKAGLPGFAGMWARGMAASRFYQPGDTSAAASPAPSGQASSGTQPMGGSAPQQRKRQAGAQSLASTDILGG
jgi:hypothetical protein